MTWRCGAGWARLCRFGASVAIAQLSAGARGPAARRISGSVADAIWRVNRRRSAKRGWAVPAVAVPAVLVLAPVALVVAVPAVAAP